jgi:hypothetical protein
MYQGRRLSKINNGYKQIWTKKWQKVIKNEGLWNGRDKVGLIEERNGEQAAHSAYKSKSLAIKNKYISCLYHG